RHQRITVTSSNTNGRQAWTIDGNGAWQPLPAPGFGYVGTAGIVFDKLRNEVVVVINGFEYDWNGSTWSFQNASFGISGWSLVFDDAIGHLVLIDNTGAMVQRQLNGTWNPIAAGMVTCVDYYANRERPVWVDNGKLSLLATDGSSICDYTTSWTGRPPNVPFSPQGVIPDIEHGGFLVLHAPFVSPTAQPVQLWATAGPWTRVTTPQEISSRQIP